MAGGTTWSFATVLVALALGSLAVPGASTASTEVGRADGVVVKQGPRGLTFVFTKRAAPLYRRIAGRRVSIRCQRFPRGGYSGSGSTTFHAPARGRVLRSGSVSDGWDYCRVWRSERRLRSGRRTRVFPRRLIVTIPFTAAGEVFVDEQNKAFLLATVIELGEFAASGSNADRFATPDRLLELTAAVSTPLSKERLPLVALSDAGETPVAGAVGYYSDGAEHAAAVVLSSAGRRLFFEVDRDDVIRTNVATYLFNGLDSLPQSAAFRTM